MNGGVAAGSGRGRRSCFFAALATAVVVAGIATAGCDKAPTLKDLEGRTARVTFLTQTRHVPATHEVDVTIGEVNIAEQSLTLVEDDFPYPVPIASVRQIEIDGIVVWVDGDKTH